MEECIMIEFKILFTLISVHFLCDYPLQGDFIGKFKNRNIPRDFGIPWWHLMTAHSFIHGLGVFVVTFNVGLGALETVIHFIIDVLKCEGYTDIHVDQALHIICKIIYVYWLIYII